MLPWFSSSVRIASPSPASWGMSPAFPAKPLMKNRAASTRSGPASPWSSLHREGDLTAVPAPHHAHRLVVVVQRELVGEDRFQVHVPALQESAHLHPRLVHQASVNPVHR